MLLFGCGELESPRLRPVAVFELLEQRVARRSFHLGARTPRHGGHARSIRASNGADSAVPLKRVSRAIVSGRPCIQSTSYGWRRRSPTTIPATPTASCAADTAASA